MQSILKMFVILLYVGFINTSCNAQYALLNPPPDKKPKPTYTNNKNFDFKFFPLSLVAGQLPQYCFEMQFAIEYRFTKHQSLQFGISGEVPGIGGVINQAAAGNYNDNGYWFYGGRGIIGYRYYLRENESNLNGLYVGGEISVNGLISRTRLDGIAYMHEEFYEFSAPNQTHLLLTNYNFTVGKHFIRKKLTLDVGVSVGYRYDYFYRQYSFGRQEYDTQTDGAYSYYKKDPIGGSLNFTIGRTF